MNPLVPQSGIGIEFQNGSFHAVYCKRFWKGFREVDRLQIPDYGARGAAECGTIYREFLRQHGLRTPWTVVALPRTQVLLRMVQFPMAMQKDLARAVEYQLDTLHPFEAGSVAWDHAIWRRAEPSRLIRTVANGGAAEAGELQTLVTIARKEYIEGLAAWFGEAGIPVSQFCPTTTLLLGYLSAAITACINAGEPYFLAHATPDGIELIGRAGSKEFVSRFVPLAPETVSDGSEAVHLLGRELELARSEMRLAPADRPEVHWCGTRDLPASAAERDSLPFRILPASADTSVGERIAGLAAGYAAVHRDGALSLNLLPEARRSFESPLATVPTYALAALVVLLAIAMGLRGPIQDWTYSRYLEQERQALQPEIQELEKLQQSNQETMAHLATLHGIRQSGALPLDLLDELTRTLPADAWLQQLQYEGSAASLSGTAPSASAVLQAVSASSYLEAAQFTAALTRTAEGKEVFRIGARLRVPNP